MYSLLIGLAAAVLAGGAAYAAGSGAGWSAAIGMSGFLAAMIVVSQFVRRKIKKINTGIQHLMEEVQHKILLKQNQFMRRPLGSPKQMMQALEKEQQSGIRRALAACDAFVPLYRWSFLLEKQINTMKMAFHYQLREFDHVDALMGKCLFFDPQSVCLKMARMYMRHDPDEEIDALFKRKCRAQKDPACVLPYSLYAWILVKQGRYEKALKVLVDAKKKTDHEVILRNWEALANQKYKSFSNAGLNEMWYALGLEEPKMPKVQQQVRRYR